VYYVQYLDVMLCFISVVAALFMFAFFSYLGCCFY